MTATCLHCGLIHSTPAPTGCALAQAVAMAQLLTQIGDPAICKGCGEEIVWVTHRNGKKVPYTWAGLNHFANCPQAAEFRKEKQHG